MTDRIRTVKTKLNDTITQLRDVSWMLSKNPERDFQEPKNVALTHLLALLPNAII